MKRMEFLRFFLRGLASLLNAGLSFSKCLESLRLQHRQPWAGKLLERLTVRVSRGETFSLALAQEPKVFPKFIVSLVHLGEETGSLPASLEKAAEFIETSFELKTKITKALSYPIFLLGITFLGLIALLNFVVPTFFPLLLGMNFALPVSTRALLALVKVFSSGWFWLGAAGLSALLYCGYAYIQRDHEKKHGLDRLLLALPGVGNVMKRGMFAQLTRTLATAQQSGIPLSRSLALLEETVDNEVFRRFIQDSLLALAHGMDLSAFFLARKDFAPPLVGHLLAVGERTGATGVLLPKCTRLLEEETEYFLTRFFKFLEPGMLVLMGILVTWVMLSVFFPLYGMMENLR